MFINKLTSLKKVSSDKLRKSFENYTLMVVEIIEREEEGVEHIQNELDIDFFNKKNKIKHA